MDDDNLSLKTIVIAEDNPALGEIYQVRLSALGYRCIVATDGEQALRYIESEQPALLLLDMMMPKVAGDEVLRRMREQTWGQKTRVFVISNLNEADAPSGLRQYNIEGYAVKANLKDDDIDKLVERILTPKDQEEDTSLEQQIQ